MKKEKMKVLMVFLLLATLFGMTETGNLEKEEVKLNWENTWVESFIEDVR